MAKTSIVDEIEHHPQFCLDLSDPLGAPAPASWLKTQKSTEFRVPVAAIIDQKRNKGLHTLDVRAVNDRSPISRAA